MTRYTHIEFRLLTLAACSAVLGLSLIASAARSEEANPLAPPMSAWTQAEPDAAPVRPQASAPARIRRGATVSREEFLAIRLGQAEAQFRRLDTNGDGQLTADERRASRD